MILIVNADDFGLSSSVNRGIIQAHTKGIVTSTSLMVRGEAAREAALLSREHPRLGVGLHLDLCEWVYRDEQWQLLYSVVPTEDARAVAAEVQGQLDAFRSLMGCEPTHLDSHQHVHFERPVRDVMQQAAEELGVPLRGFQEGITYCGEFYGQSNKGDAFPEGVTVEHLLGILRRLRRGTELGCHPAATADIDSVYNQERVLELHSLCDARVLAAIAETGIELRSFRDFGTQAGPQTRPPGTPDAKL